MAKHPASSWTSRILLGVGVLCLSGAARAENAVDVTLEAGATTLLIGQTTTVTVSGRIAPAIEADSDRIFSWYIDVLNDDGGVATGFANVQTPTSDNGPPVFGSSDGTADGPHLRGIYDYFTGTPAAGNGAPIVLVQFEVTALAPGIATFRAAPGTTGPGSFDFTVSATGGDSFTGGDYSAASLAITVLAPVDPDDLDLVVVRNGDEGRLNFSPFAGYDHTAQWSPTLEPGSWTNLPFGPHNSGNVIDDIAGVSARFYRVLLTGP